MCDARSNSSWLFLLFGICEFCEFCRGGTYCYSLIALHFAYFSCVLNNVLIHFLDVQVKNRLSTLTQNAVESGARLLLDGRNVVVIIYPLLF